MSPTTDDPNDPRLTRGPDDGPRPQAEAYLVLSDDERAKGWIRPLRLSYRHRTCGTHTSMGLAIAETYARNPKFYGYTYCVTCAQHFPVAEFDWIEDDGASHGHQVGS